MLAFILFSKSEIETQNICGGEYKMEKFYLEMPSLERKNQIIDYVNEFALYNSETNGMGSLRKILEGYTFEQALEMCLRMQDEEYAKNLGRCQSKTFLLIRENDDRIIGAINVRWNLPESMKQFGGNIGYGIRPTERRKGYNKINLYLGLIEAQKLGLNLVMLDCDVNNLGSVKTMQALDGKLERTEVDPSDGILTSVYWFDVNETIDKYQNVFKKCIKKKMNKKEMGIDKFRFYDLRGNFDTVSLRNGAKIREIADILGHSNVETTENYYISSSNETLKSVVKNFENNVQSDVINNIIKYK